MVYADFGYYQSVFYGKSLEMEDFDRCAVRASAYMDYYTLGKVKNKADLDAVKMCCCALAEQYKIIEAAEAQSASGQEVKSQSVGRWSKTYTTGADLEANAKARLKSIAIEYLANTGLLYRGVNGCVSSCCEHI